MKQSVKTGLVMINYFLDALKYISENKGVPYFLEGKIRDLGNTLSIKDNGQIIKFIIKHNNASDCFRYLNNRKLLRHIFPPLHNLKAVPQNKKQSKNAFEHTIRVLDCVPIEKLDLRWVALFHDLGKSECFKDNENFIHHNVYSAGLTTTYCDIFEIPKANKIRKIVYNHMLPQDYQRNPVWKEETIKKFIERCKKNYVEETIWFAYYDKQAENNIPAYLQPYLDLIEKVKMLNGTN